MPILGLSSPFPQTSPHFVFRLPHFLWHRTLYNAEPVIIYAGLAVLERYVGPQWTDRRISEAFRAIKTERGEL